MPYTTELTEDCMGVVHVGSGIVTGPEVLKGSQAVSQLVQNTENFHFEFVDLTAATQVVIEPVELKEIAALDRMTSYFRPNAIVVIVADSPHILEVARNWEQQVQDLGWSTHISRERGEALRWLRETLRSHAETVQARDEAPLP